MNLYRDIEPGSPDEMNVIVEIPKGSHNKFEIDKETGLIALDRANYSGAPYPIEYGFVPQTHWDDGDALDVLVLATYPLPTGVLVKARPVGIMYMIDGGENDAKILAVPIHDKRWEHVEDIDDVNPHTLKELQHFFETYKALKGKGDVVKIEGFKGRKEAQEAFEKGRELYQKKMAS